MTRHLLFDRQGTRLALILAALACGGCEGDLPEYNQLAGFRVLALRASPPSLSEGESTLLDALTFVEDEPDPRLRYRWSWCPARLPSSVGGDCAVDESEFARLLGLDSGEVDFDLGDEATAEFNYPGRAEAYRAACENSADAEARDDLVFTCEGGFPVSIRAEITYREQTIRIQKDVRLLFGDVLANENPELGGILFRAANGKAGPKPWPEDSLVSLTLGRRYEVEAELDKASAERFVPVATAVDPSPDQRRESLYLSWFVSSGETDQRRTSFVEDGLSLEESGKNTWLLPKAGDEKRRTARMFLVLRDERGGTTWVSREAELVR